MRAVFWFLFGLVAWCYAGYPLVMLLWARLRPRPTSTSAWTPLLSVVLSVRDEEARIEGRLADLRRQDYAGRWETIVVCNGCTDATEERARAVAAESEDLRVLVSPGEDGKAGALNAGVAAARGEVVVFADARQRFEPEVLTRLVAALGDPSVGAVSGRLVIAASPSAAAEGMRRYWQIEVALRRAESATGSVVGVTGAIYAIRRSLYDPLPPGLILDDVLIPMRIVFGGHRVLFIDDAIAHDEAAEPGREFGRKVRTMVGNIQLLRVEPRLLLPGTNPVFGRYVSHKLLRLATPLCLLGMLGAGWLAGGAFYHALVGAQLAFYALGALGLVFPVRWLGVPTGFLLAHVAVLTALLRPTRGAEAVWKRSAP